MDLAVKMRLALHLFKNRFKTVLQIPLTSFICIFVKLEPWTK